MLGRGGSPWPLLLLQVKSKPCRPPLWFFTETKENNVTSKLTATISASSYQHNTEFQVPLVKQLVLPWKLFPRQIV